MAHPRRRARLARRGRRRARVPGAVGPAHQPARGTSVALAASAFSPLALGAGLVAICTAHLARDRPRPHRARRHDHRAAASCSGASTPPPERSLRVGVPAFLFAVIAFGWGLYLRTRRELVASLRERGAATGGRAAAQRGTGPRGGAAAHRPGDARCPGPPAVPAQRARWRAGVPAGTPGRGDHPGRSRDPDVGAPPRYATCARSSPCSARTPTSGRGAAANLAQLPDLLEESRAAGMTLREHLD